VRRVLWWLKLRDLTGFNGLSLAPLTEAKAEVADSRHTMIEQTVIDAYRERTGPFAGSVTTAADVAESLQIAFPSDDKQAGLAAIAKAMHEAGCRQIVKKQIRVDAKQVRLWARTKKLAARWSSMEPAELATLYKQQRAIKPLSPGYDPLA
jgi:2,4-dienoyl-CoA reductase-like NADH-dependent reductase (Old Yellow Enzyme family)